MTPTPREPDHQPTDARVDQPSTGRATELTAQPATEHSWVYGWSRNTYGVQQSTSTVRLVDEPLAAAWLSEHAVPVGVFRNVAGQWHREAVARPESLSPAAAAAVNATGMDSAQLWRKLDALFDDTQLDNVQLNLRVGTAMVAVSVLSVGYVIWTLRGSNLMASLLAQLPIWAGFDPLPVLEFPDADRNAKRPDDDDGDVPGDPSLDELIDRSRANEPAAVS